MHDPALDLLPIGRFAAATQLSVRVLRHYGDVGLLPPARVDHASGYRYYRREQIGRARLIRLLRALDVPLADIGRIVGAPERSTAVARLDAHWASVEEKLREQRLLLAYVRRLLHEVPAMDDDNPGATSHLPDQRSHPSAARILASAPVLLVRDLVRSAEYFRDRVGFTFDRLWGEPPDFCIVRRDSCSLMLSRVDDPAQIVPHWRIRDKMWNVYFWVDDAERLYDELRERGALIDYSLCVQPHGTKEFGIQDLDGHDIGFGQSLSSS